ncbi:sperm flagellar protein 2-like isoform X2 [Osmia lignaria lignaria]|uniref:sperm flagellar protein 2-like isoform X2 n=1 Tax=Osmia lignaria lignaria TaxID=1437193 RepID=UPI00402B9F72
MHRSIQRMNERSTMGEILRSWIQARLGAMIDLTPDMFGHYTRDGTLLAQMLHSYDIINRDQLETIVHTQDPALCRVNLKHLKFWLRFLGIDCDDESIAEISCGKGATSLRLFYKLYLCLEGKDRLHFITLQKEREKFVPTSKKFEVTTVSEDPSAYEPPDHPFCSKLVKGKTEMGRFKIPLLLRKLRRKREKLEQPWKPYSIVQPVEYCFPKTEKSLDESKMEESEELDRFARMHRVRPKRFEQFEEEERYLEEEKERFEKMLEELTEEPEAAKAYVEQLKCRTKCAEMTAALKCQMQRSLLCELWERMEKKQDRSFDEAIARRTSDQCRYEKQMVSKLCEVRDQKNAMAENQRIVENMTLKANELEHRARLELEKDLACRKQKDVETECERMCELRRRLLEEKIEKIRKKHFKLCRLALQDLTSVALNIGEYRRVNDGNVPLSLLSEWKTMFLKCQPIYDEKFSKEMEEDEESEPEPELMADDKGWCALLERSEAQRQVLLQDYLDTNSPWNEFTPMLGEDERETFELGRVVLGYVVHRLLNALYPRPPNRAQLLLSKFKTAAILLGIGNSQLHRSIGLLLEKSGIRLVRMEDAINYCLQRYKEEMSNVEYVDSTVIAATNDAVRKLRGKKRPPCPPPSSKNSSISEAKGSRVTEDKETKSTTKSSKTARTRGRTRTGARGRDRDRENEKDSKMLEKETQTPRNIPFDDLDPVLTDAAYIGKWVYEFLTLGEPIDDELATKTLVEYLKSVTDAKGWALIDYPNTYEQMCRLETAVTGVVPPPDPKELDFQDVTIEDIEGIETLPRRIVFEDQEDPFALNRRSRLLPDPIANRDTSATRSTFVTLFVRIAQKPKGFQADRSYETVGKDAASIDKFYASLKNAYALYYSSLDANTLKRLARLVIGEPLQRRPSDELFGDVLNELDPGTGQQVVGGSRAPVVRRVLPDGENLEPDIDYIDDVDRLSIGTRDSVRDYFRTDWLTAEPGPARPGEPNWQWIDFPLPSGLLESLANLWECLENAYVENVREMLYLKSVHVSSVVPYRDFVTRNMKDFIRRPDNKQDLLNEFHKAFNSIDPDARHDVDVKCELHRRVADFQATLWDICDKRKVEAEGERRRLIADHWTVLEASILYNVFVGLVQAELDRFVDTKLSIEDYYLGMLKKPLPVSVGQKVIFNRIEVETGAEEPLRFEERPAQESSGTEVEQRTTDRKKERSGRKTKLVDVVPPAVDLAVLRRQIDDALIDRNKRFRGADDCCAFQGIMEIVRYARNVVDALSSTASELVKKERLAALRLDKDLLTDSGDSIIARTVSRGEELALEWRYAISYEINRVRLKLDSIIAVARMDFIFLLDSLQRTFHEIYDVIVDRYWRETRSVNEMGNVFCFAIEEGRIIENELLLEDDNFVVRSNVFVTEVDLEKRKSALKETLSSSRFRIADLARLMEIFKRVAPYGTISERAFVYILQDLASHGREEGESMLLPCRWYQLRASEVCKVVRSLFGTVDHIDWREFVVYAMDLPWPSHHDLLMARERFRAQDPDLRETVTRAQFYRTSLWFLDSSVVDTEIYDLLHDDFHTIVEQLYEEELYRSSLEDGDSGVFGIKKSSIADLKSRRSNPEETLRRMLSKELLCRMYAVDRHTINYTALLLVFCKHEDPKEGFGKALALALGNKVCTDMEEGERYVQEVYERKRLGLSWHRISRSEALEVTRQILEQLLDRATALDFEEEAEEVEDATTLSRDSVASIAYTANFEFEDEATWFPDDAVFTEKRLSKELIVYWLSLDLCLTVLAATLPWHVLQPEVTGNCSNLRDRLSIVFKEMRDEYLNEQKDVALAHRLLNHDFIQRLLNSVSNFTIKNIGDIVQKILQSREQNIG